MGRLKPNDWGLFDMLGNALEWVEDPGLVYATGVLEDREDVRYLEINERSNRLLRGGSFNLPPANLRCADRGGLRPSFDSNATGFRPARTSDR